MVLINNELDWMNSHETYDLYKYLVSNGLDDLYNLDITSNCQYFNENTLYNTLSNTNVTVMSSNIQSLPAKFESLKTFLQVSQVNNRMFDFVALQKIWRLTDPSLFNPSNYNMIISERKKGQGGGVAWYVNKKFPFKILDNYQFLKKTFLKCLLLRLKFMGKKLFYPTCTDPIHTKFSQTRLNLIVFGTFLKNILIPYQTLMCLFIYLLI